MTLHFLALQLGISLCRRSFPMAEGRHKAIASCSAVDMSGWPHCGRSITTWGAAATLPPELFLATSGQPDSVLQSWQLRGQARTDKDLHSR